MIDSGVPRLDLETAGRVATVTIANPAKRNAMTAAMWRALPPLLDRLAQDPQVRVVVLTGAGGTFCAGADIADLAEVGADSDDANLAALAEEHLAAFPKPTVAWIQGHCVGGGCQLALACDVRFAAPGTRFGITPAKLGIVYPVGSTRRLVEVAGAATARLLLLSGELVDAARAERLGLVTELVDSHGPDRLPNRVADFSRELARRSLLSQAAAKDLISLAGDRDAGEARARHWTREMRDSGEAVEGAAAFLARRQPHFPWK